MDLASMACRLSYCSLVRAQPRNLSLPMLFTSTKLYSQSFYSSGRVPLLQIDEDIQRHKELLEAIRGSPSEINEIVARRRKDFTDEFFKHISIAIGSNYDKREEAFALAELGDMCYAAVNAYDAEAESLSIEAIKAAKLKLKDIVNSPTLDAACRKIDNLAENRQLDSALVLLIRKAWEDGKETNMMKDEVKDVLFHLYKTTSDNLERQLPKEVRILRSLLSIEDHEHKIHALRKAFTPGDEFMEIDEDNLCTTPKRLHILIKRWMSKKNHRRLGTTSYSDVVDLTDPGVMQKLKELSKLIKAKFM